MGNKLFLELKSGRAELVGKCELSRVLKCNSPNEEDGTELGKTFMLQVFRVEYVLETN